MNRLETIKLVEQKLESVTNVLKDWENGRGPKNSDEVLDFGKQSKELEEELEKLVADLKEDESLEATNILVKLESDLFSLITSVRNLIARLGKTQ